MSQGIPITFTCPHCRAQSQTEIFRTIWGEVPTNRELVFTNRINRLTCPRCSRTSFAATSLMYTNAKLRFAVWFEPNYDSQIDAELIKYTEFFKQRGPAYAYLQAPPRVRDWEAFKELIKKYEAGEIVTDSQRLAASTAQGPTGQASRGCLGVILAILAAISLVVSAVIVAVR